MLRRQKEKKPCVFGSAGFSLLVTNTGPGCIGVVRGVRVLSSHQQTDKASANTWFELEHCKPCNTHLP